MIKFENYSSHNLAFIDKARKNSIIYTSSSALIFLKLCQ